MLFDRVPIFRYPVFVDDGRMAVEFYGLLGAVLLITFVAVYIERRKGLKDNEVLGFGLFCAITCLVAGGFILHMPGAIMLIAMFVFVISLAAWLGGKGGSNG